VTPATLTVALLQLSAPSDEARALAVGERACREAAALGADVALFAEAWQVGYGWGPPGSTAAADALATTHDGPFVTRFRELARELGLAIVATYLQRWPGGPRNAATLIDRRGRLALTYAKVHTCDFGDEAQLTPGDRFTTADLEVASGTVRIGLMVCFDREFPEAARALALGGAEVVLVPNACALPDVRVEQVRTRAYENMVGIAVANYAAPEHVAAGGHEAYDGRSLACSGICFGPDRAPLDQTLVEAGRGEEIALATFDLDALREYRARESWGDAYRRPGAYGLLVDGPVAPVFVRADARREVVRAPTVCDACGASFGCGAGTGSCWCVEETVPTDVLGALRDAYDGCLCPDCLRAAAAGRPHSAGPSAISSASGSVVAVRRPKPA